MRWVLVCHRSVSGDLDSGRRTQGRVGTAESNDRASTSRAAAHPSEQILAWKFKRTAPASFRSSGSGPISSNRCLPNIDQDQIVFPAKCRSSSSRFTLDKFPPEQLSIATTTEKKKRSLNHYAKICVKTSNTPQHLKCTRAVETTENEDGRGPRFEYNGGRVI